MEFSLPTSVIIGENEYKIRNDCDYRVILDVIEALKDKELDPNHALYCALYIFYQDFEKIDDMKQAIASMYDIINCGEKPKLDNDSKPPIMDWKHDFHMIAPAVNRVLGYEVRDPNRLTHWYTFIGAYMEIGDCYYAQVISIRRKRQKGRKLDDIDRRFYEDNKSDIDIPIELSEVDKEWLDSDW